MLPAPMEAQHVSQDTRRGETEAQLSREQSLCLVKVFINASLGCICLARGLIPSDSPTYQDRRVDDLLLIPFTSSLASYHGFLSYQGRLSVDNESQLFKVLLGGKTNVLIRFSILWYVIVRTLVWAEGISGEGRPQSKT